ADAPARFPQIAHPDSMNCLLLFAIVMCCSLHAGDAAPPAAHHLHRRPRPLDNSATWNNLIIVAKHAQEKDRNHNTRLIPIIPDEKLKDKDTCCLSANILDYYLRNILHVRGNHHKRLSAVKEDLHRVRRDLVDLAKCVGEEAPNKAIGEIDILFHYLYESCN
uniref:Interleukin 22 n=1 Tax=Denticeps clupeoides TaxID=299321 RepID=A0AAY4EKQ6_9TELE